jgi:hypothetical protein
LLNLSEKNGAKNDQEQGRGSNLDSRGLLGLSLGRVFPVFVDVSLFLAFFALFAFLAFLLSLNFLGFLRVVTFVGALSYWMVRISSAILSSITGFDALDWDFMVMAVYAPAGR